MAVSMLPASGQESAETIEIAEKSVVRIEVKTADNELQGSGFVVDSSGTLITNCHVIENAISATAVFPNGERFPLIRIRGMDERRDIAVVQIARVLGPPFQPLALVDTQPRKGEAVIALGTPRGLSFTVTRGIVSAIRSALEMQRDVGVRDAEGTWIQVDAAISSGNSGGPIINERGQVVAMSTLVHTEAQNVNFGISATDIKQFIESTASDPWKPLPIGARTSARPPTRMSSKSDYKAEFNELVSLIPNKAILDFALEIEALIPKYKKDILKTLGELRAFSRELEAAEVDPVFVHGSNSMQTRRVSVNGKLVNRVFFASIDAKYRKIDEAKSLVKDIETVIATGKVNTLNGWKAILCLVGPALDIRVDKTVGIVRGARRMQQIDDIFIIVIDGSLGVLATEDARKMGAMDFNLGAFIGGTAQTRTVNTANGTKSLPIICQIPDSKLEEALLGPNLPSQNPPDSQEGTPQSRATSTDDQEMKAITEDLFKADANPQNTDGYREWNDRTGNFTVEAKLVSKTQSHVTLRRKDGKVLTVEIAKLSDADNRYVLGK
ncbi:MAG: trypsin-like peptidase domain-containing protein [Planctomycetota bacterium]|nr:trypsin-like peptidase domain-containing protein [Planctomycetota bacterium]